MGLRCLLGHDFGDIEIEREREEEGEEMVVTVREVKTCERCGQQRVVSENKEVTSIRPPAEATAETVTADTAGDRSADARAADGVDAGADEADAERGAPRRSGVSAGTGADDATGDGAAFVDAGADADSGSPSSVEGDAVPDTEAAEGAGAGGFNDDEFEPPIDAEEDDGVILDDEGLADAERSHGEWPDSDDVGRDEPSEAGAWPEQEGEDEGYDAESPDGRATDVEFGDGLTPQMQAAESDLDDGVRADEGYDAEFIESTEPAPDADGFVRADTAEVGGEESGVPTEYYCPSCGMTRTAGSSSMRAGDICPECKTGYVTEREQ